MSLHDLPLTIAADAAGAAPTTLPSLSEPLRVTVAGHDLRIFVQTWPLIKSMVEDICSAQKRVWLESYIFLNDAAGKAIGEALKERARAGVDVRLLYDAIGSQTTPTSFFRGSSARASKFMSFTRCGRRSGTSHLCAC